MKFKQRLEGQEGSRFLGERMFLAKEALSAKAPRQAWSSNSQAASVAGPNSNGLPSSFKCGGGAFIESRLSKVPA